MRNKLIFNKKAETSFKQIMFMGVLMTILLIIFLSVVFVARKYIVTTAEIEDLEAEVMMRSLMTNRNSIIFYDKDIGRTYPYTVDLTKFNRNYPLEQTFDYGKDQRIFAAKLSLFDINGNPYNYKGAVLQPIYINEGKYQAWLVMARAKTLGPGGAIEKTKKFDISAIEDGKIKPAIIEISIVMPRT